jgi:hypothetical protein
LDMVDGGGCVSIDRPPEAAMIIQVPSSKPSHPSAHIYIYIQSIYLCLEEDDREGWPEGTQPPEPRPGLLIHAACSSPPPLCHRWDWDDMNPPLLTSSTSGDLRFIIQPQSKRTKPAAEKRKTKKKFEGVAVRARVVRFSGGNAPLE